MRRSQEQPVKNATAAGGKRIVTCERDKYWVIECGGALTRMRRMSDPRTMLEIIEVESWRSTRSYGVNVKRCTNNDKAAQK